MRILQVMNMLLIAILMMSCSSNKAKHVTQSNAINPNGDTELALLMREMYDDGMQMKAAIENGDDPQSQVDVSRLAVAKATMPAKVATQEYQTFAMVYQSHIQSLQDSEGKDKIGSYKALVNTCVACHTSLCPGPLTRIKKMELSNTVSD